MRTCQSDVQVRTESVRASCAVGGLAHRLSPSCAGLLKMMCIGNRFSAVSHQRIGEVKENDKGWALIFWSAIKLGMQPEGSRLRFDQKSWIVVK